MLSIDLSVTNHQLNIDPSTRNMAQLRRRESPEKDEAIMKIVYGLLDANFISEVRYNEWISNLVPVKKALGKWRI